MRSGGRIFEHTHGGKDQWEYFQASARQEHQFSRAMASVEHLGATCDKSVKGKLRSMQLAGAPLVASSFDDSFVAGTPLYVCYGLRQAPGCDLKFRIYPNLQSYARSSMIA